MNCYKGYPSCMNAELSGVSCDGECVVTLEKELEALISKRSAMQEKHMAKYRDGSATRARTTTHNANVSMVNDQIIDLRARLKG